MIGALVPSAAAYAIRRRMAAPILDKRFHVPTSRTIDAPLIGGAALFGLGWGLVGLCPARPSPPSSAANGRRWSSPSP
jgi:uncharacterized membrane protein YedE/YeeE